MKASLSPKTKRYLYNGAGIFLSGLFIYLAFHFLGDTHWKEIFALTHPSYLIWAVVLNFVAMGLRAYLWQVLLSPVKKLPYFTLLDILHVGYMANNLLPLKAGEFFRASFVSKKWKLPYTQVLTTIGLERYFAGLALLGFFFAIAYQLEIPTWLKTSVYILGGSLITVQIFLWLLWAKKPNLTYWKNRRPWLYRIIKTLYDIGEGSSLLKSLSSFSFLILLAALTWVVQIFLLRFIESAYGLYLPWSATIFVVVAINLAITLPSAPGNLGTFELAAILAYTFVGVSRADGLGMGIFFHFLQIIPTTLVGLFFYWRWGIRFKEIEQTAETKLEEAIS